MADNEDDWVKKRAYALWEEEGYPSGKHDEHWQRARDEFAAFNSGSSKKASTREAPPKKQAPLPSAEPVSKKPAAKRAKKPTAAS